MAKATLLVECVEENFVTPKEDIYEYARLIGIDVKNEKHLLWIAESGLNANVPEPWLILSDNKNRIFYHNKQTGESSWFHPLDKEYSALVIEERTKSINSTYSDVESKLSSLADAPPLSPGGKSTSSSLKRTKNEDRISGSSKKLDIGHFENRRTTQLAPMRIGSVKASPQPLQRGLGGGKSFMPKGASLTRNVKLVKEPTRQEDKQIDNIRKNLRQQHDLNESETSDASHYSYEESDNEDKNVSEQHDSDLSPSESSDASPKPMEINSIINLGKRIDNKASILKSPVPGMGLKEEQLSLSLRKAGQLSALRPLQPVVKKKPKGKKPKVSESESDIDQIHAISDEKQEASQHKRMQATKEQINRDEYQQYNKENLEEIKALEMKMRKENAETLSKLKSELSNEIEEEKSSGEKQLEALRKINNEKLREEEQRLQKELQLLKETFVKEQEELKNKNLLELNQQKEKMKGEQKITLQNMQEDHKIALKNIKEAHATEMAFLENQHKEEVAGLQEMRDKETENQVNREMSEMEKNLKSSLGDLKQLVSQEEEKYQELRADIAKLSKENEQMLKQQSKLNQEIKSTEDDLKKLEEQRNTFQTDNENVLSEIEKLESDLDILTNQKTALVSELSSLKDRIVKEKSNSPAKRKSVQEKIETGVNTVITNVGCVSKCSQTNISVDQIACQVNIQDDNHDASCQTIQPNFANKICQAEELPPVKNVVEESKHSLISEATNMQSFLNENLDKALNKIRNHLDDRIQTMEQQLRGFRDRLDSKTQPDISATSNDLNHNNSVLIGGNGVQPNFISHESIKTVPNGSNALNILPNHSSSSHGQCRCEIGDTSSCNIMNDIKASVYNLNNILHRSIAMPNMMNNNPLSGLNYPLTYNPSSLEKFYSNYKALKERQQLLELKHRCENEVDRLRPPTVTISDSERENAADDFPYSLHSPLHSNFIPQNAPRNPLVRARNILLREKARMWKQQQMNSSDSSAISFEHSFSTSENCDQNTLPHEVTDIVLPSHQFPTFEQDAASDYNNWMIRLNALHQRIRCHRMV